MTNREKKLWDILNKYGFSEWRKTRKCLFSDLTALISEDYVEKEKYDEAVRQRDELKRMLNSLILSICAHPDYVSGEEGDEWHDLTSLAEASIRSTESI